MDSFIKSHPNFKQLMKNMKDLPRWVLPKGANIPIVSAHDAGNVARQFRRSFVLPFNKWNSTRYISSATKQLNGRLNLFKGLGNAATWYIPAAIGLYEVAQAPQGQKMQEFFGQGFSVVWGVYWNTDWPFGS